MELNSHPFLTIIRAKFKAFSIAGPTIVVFILLLFKKKTYLHNICIYVLYITRLIFCDSIFYFKKQANAKRMLGFVILQDCLLRSNIYHKKLKTYPDHSKISHCANTRPFCPPWILSLLWAFLKFGVGSRSSKLSRVATRPSISNGFRSARDALIKRVNKLSKPSENYCEEKK